MRNLTQFPIASGAVAVIFAALSAVSYGLGDYCGGRASRDADSFVVTFVGQLFSVLLIVAALFAFGDPVPGAHDWLWGAAGGVGGFIGLSLFYLALSKGAMTVVAPLTAMVSSIVPAAAGVLLGERPNLLGYIGIVVALAGIALVTGAVGIAHQKVSVSIVVFAVLGGCGFGWMYVCLDRAHEDAGMWPLLAARIASISIAGVVILARRSDGPRFVGIGLLAMVAGMFDMAANILFVVANHRGLLSLVSVVASLYPVSTIVLAMRIDRERVTRSQVGGMVLAGVALAFVSLGA